ncbi:MAG: MipA/OmpV family protein [Inhella sp.]|jgi:outer membrane scaffolding protein for murein synthesis (MipA/OmpV family)|uniref:MipA/OmpV family protein n=1 Tax=Inhella sp. TaxID=1921806 RepID=UPI0039191CC5
MTHRPIRLALLATGFALTQGAHAQTDEGPPRWELGAVGLAVSQQAYPGSDQQLGRVRVLPYALYRGRWLRADGETVGLRAARTAQWELDIGAAASFGGGGDDIEARRGMQRLGNLVEFGPRLKWRLGEGSTSGGWRLALPLRGVFDLSDRLRHRGWALEPELTRGWRPAEGWRTSMSLGAIVADRTLADTFYGVKTSQATALRPAYQARSGLVAWRLSASFNRELNRDWRVFGFVRTDSLAGAANRASPLVKQTTGTTVGLGVSVTLARSSASGVD